MPATVNTPPMIAHVVVMKWYLHSSVSSRRHKLWQPDCKQLHAQLTLCASFAARHAVSKLSGMSSFGTLLSNDLRLCACASDGGRSLPCAVLLADQYLDRRQVVRKLCGWHVSRVIGVAVHLHAIGEGADPLEWAYRIPKSGLWSRTSDNADIYSLMSMQKTLTVYSYAS